MIRKPAYLTVQDDSGFNLDGIAVQVLDDFPNLDMEVVEDNSAYFVLRFIYDDFVEVQEVVAAVSYLLIQETIFEFKITLNCDE